MTRKQIALQLFLIAAGAASASAAGIIIGYTNAMAVTNVPQTVMDRVGQLRLFFTHASVGGNIITGMNQLHTNNPTRYRLAIHDYDGLNGDEDYHGAIGTLGSEYDSDYRADVPAGATTNGLIYECQRSNPGWSQKLICFSNSLTTSGWGSPERINIAMDKFCWIDPDADATTYVESIRVLEGMFPRTLIVYATIPLTRSGEDDADNDTRMTFNRYVRGWVATNNRVLLDIADIEAHNTSGVEQLFVYSGRTNQQAWSGYTVDAGHLNYIGRRQIAMGWYALAASLFATDRDGDGQTDGEELMAGMCPTSSASCFQLSAPSNTGSRFMVSWPSASNRYYVLQRTTNLTGVTVYTNLLTNATAHPPLNIYTDAPAGAGPWFYKVSVRQ